MNNYALKKRLNTALVLIVKYIILIGISFIILYPLFSKFVIAFMDRQDLMDASVKYIPKNFTMKNVMSAISSVNYFNTLLKSVVFVFSLSLLQIISTMLAGYGFSRFDFPFKSILFLCVLFTLIVPNQIISVPIYIYFNNFNFFGLLGDNGIRLLDTPVPMFLLSITAVGLNNGLYIFLFRQYFSGFPKELEEAAGIDGAGAFRTFLSVIVPSCKPMMVTCFLFSFVWQWTDNFYLNTFWPKNTFLITLIERLPSSSWMQSSDDYLRSIMNNTGILLVIIPLIILYLFSQRYFVESMENSGLVG